jgi:hypothetical protein
MNEAKKRALELVDRAETDAEDVCAMDFPEAIRSRFSDLRAAIQAIGAWQPLETAPLGVAVRLLWENGDVQTMRLRGVSNAHVSSDGEWWDRDDNEPLQAHLRPLAWKPADSTELPAEEPTK